MFSVKNGNQHARNTPAHSSLIDLEPVHSAHMKRSIMIAIEIRVPVLAPSIFSLASSLSVSFRWIGHRRSSVEGRTFSQHFIFSNIKLRQEISSSTINIAMTNDPLFSPLIVHISAHVRPENKVKIKKKTSAPNYFDPCYRNQTFFWP